MIDREHWLYNRNSYFQPYVIFTPEEIEEIGCVPVYFPTFIHDFENPRNPIMKSYCDGNDESKLPIVNKTYNTKIAGIRGLSHYNSNREQFKPVIVEEIKRLQLHYIYHVTLSESPVIMPDEKIFFPVYVRGCRLPKKHIDIQSSTI